MVDPTGVVPGEDAEAEGAMARATVDAMATAKMVGVFM
jgi:hypothetical protein